MQKIISLCKRRGFIFQSSEIYGGVAGLWDLGPLGALMKENLRKFWLKRFVLEENYNPPTTLPLAKSERAPNVVLINGTCLMHPKVWEASGHLEYFTDPLVECKNCHSRFRADHLMSGRFIGQGKAKTNGQCPDCGEKEFTEPRMFNLMFKTFLGPVEDKAHQTYLRPETAQSMFTNFQNILNSSRLKIPFGIAQIGRSFRNEITLGDFTFRSREFDIAEIEYFVEPERDEKYFEIWLDKWEKFFLDLGIEKKNLRRFEHPKKSLAHYSKRTVDIEYKFPFGWAELAGVANRTDYDLRRHSEFSGQDLRYFDEEKKKKYFPYVIEPTMGLERAILAILCDTYQEIPGGRTKTTKSTKEVEILLRLDKKIAPIKVAILPLVRNKPELVKKAKEVYQLLKPHFVCQYDELGSIGRRYRRQDEIGTIFCLTIDFESLKQDDLTVRNRDTMEQKRVKIKDLIKILKEKLEF